MSRSMCMTAVQGFERARDMLRSGGDSDAALAEMADALSCLAGALHNLYVLQDLGGTAPRAEGAEAHRRPTM